MTENILVVIKRKYEMMMGAFLTQVDCKNLFKEVDKVKQDLADDIYNKFFKHYFDTPAYFTYVMVNDWKKIMKKHKVELQWIKKK